MNRAACMALAALAVAAAIPPEAEAGGWSRAVRSTRRRHHRIERGRIVGHGVSEGDLRRAPLARPSGRVAVRFPALDAEAEVEIYAANGSYDQAALEQLDQVFRCRRTREERALDPRLYEMLSVIHDHFGATIQVTSGFRYQRNEESRHFHGSAVDISIPGVTTDELYTFAESLDAGGMGIGKYPHGDFVHIDFRAPGEPSYRWTDSRRSRRRPDPGKTPSRMWRRETLAAR